MRHLGQPLHHNPFAFCRVNLGGKCAQAGMGRDRSGLVENTVPFGIRKFRKFKPEFLICSNGTRPLCHPQAQCAPCIIISRKSHVLILSTTDLGAGVVTGFARIASHFGFVRKRKKKDEKTRAGKLWGSLFLKTRSKPIRRKASKQCDSSYLPD